MMNRICGLFAGAMVAVLCDGMLAGCSDKEEFWWDDDRSNAKVVGFVDDSLVIVGDFRFWHETTERWNGEYLEGRGAGNPRLCLYNYRVQEDGPRWCDSLSEEKSSGWFGGQMTDSIVWGGVLGEYIKLWKIGDEPHEMKLSKSFEGCSQKVSVQRIHQWLDGKFIALGSYSMNSRTFDNALTSLDSGASYCQYAVLDTVARTITYKRLDEKLKWIGKCDDVRAWGNDVYCLEKNIEGMKLSLWMDNILSDSIYVENVAFWDLGTVRLSSLSFYGDLVYWGYLFSLKFDEKKFDFGLNVRPMSFPGFGNFVDDEKGFVSYD